MCQVLYYLLEILGEQNKDSWPDDTYIQEQEIKQKMINI